MAAQIYELELSNGKRIKAELDAPPTAEDFAALEAAASQEPDTPAPAQAQQKPKMRFSMAASLKGEDGWIEPKGNDADWKAFQAAKPGEGFKWGGGNAVKTSATDFEMDERPLTPEEEKAMANRRFKAAGMEAIQSLAPGAAGMGAFGALARLMKIGETASKTAKVAKTVGALGGSIGAAAGTRVAQDAALEAVAPDTMAGIRDAQAQEPLATAIGGILGGNAPYQRIGAVGPLGRELAERALGAGIGGGIEVGRQAMSDQPFDLSLIGANAAGGAIFNNPTELGNVALARGAKSADFITSKLGSATTKNAKNPVAANAAANEIAMPPEPAIPPTANPDPGLAAPGHVIPREGMPVLRDPSLEAQAAMVAADQNPLGYAEMPEDLSSLRVEMEPSTIGRKTINTNIGRPVAPGTRAESTVLADLLKRDLIPEPTQSARSTRLAELMAAGEEIPVTQPKPQPRDTTTGFNELVARTTRNLANEGVEVDRQTAAKLARLASNPEEFNRARQQLIDSVRQKAPEIPEQGPIKSLEELPPKMGQDDAAVIDTPGETTPTRPQIKSDYDRYQEIQKEWAGLIKSGKGEGPEVQRLRAENEEIKNRHGGMPPEPTTPASGPASEDSSTHQKFGIVPPEDPGITAAKAFRDRANERLSEMMARTDTEATNPVAQRDMMASLLGQEPAQEQEPSVSFPKPGEGRAQTREEMARLTSKNYEDGMLPTTDSVTGRTIRSYRARGEEPPAWMVENEKKNGDVIWERLNKKAKEGGEKETPITREVAGEIAQVPEHYRPFLTDIASRWKFMDAPILRTINSGIGGIAKVIKRQLGLLKDNLADVYPPLEGAVIERDHMEGKLFNGWMEASTGPTKARENLSREDFAEYKRILARGTREELNTFLSSKNKGKEIADGTNFILDNLPKIRDMLIRSGREVGEIPDYFPTRVADYKGLTKMLGRESTTGYDTAVKDFFRENGRQPNTKEREAILNKILSGGSTRKGGPGFAKSRTMGDLSKEMLEFYEDPDVALQMFYADAARDIANNAFLGKIDTEAPKSGDGEKMPWDGTSSFGRLVQQGLDSGAISSQRGLPIIIDNMRDYMRRSQSAREDLTKLAAKLRRAQTALYLSDVSSAIVQYLDVLSLAREYGVTSAATAYGRNMPDVKQIGVSEGHNVDLNELSKAPKGSFNPGRWMGYRWALKNLLGKADEMQKSALMKAATSAMSKAIRDPKSRLFRQMDERYSKMFPDRWESMKTSLASDDFAKGKLDDNTKLFLFAEMARLQPISSASRAQGFHAATPWGKLAYALRSYWLTQLSILRRQGYNEMKKGTWAGFQRGAVAMLSYSAIVGMGQQGFQYAKDKIFGREEADIEDYLTGGVLQLIGVPRYALYRAAQIGPGTAALETALPGTGAVNDFGKDYRTTMKFLTGHQGTDTSESVEDFGDWITQLESTKYAPVAGREFHALIGSGKRKYEKEQDRVNRGGDPRKGASEQILDFFVPQDSKRR